jgi:hypothetical protein
VPAPPALPTIRAAAPSRKPPRAIPKAIVARMRKDACEDEDGGDGGPAQTYRLDATHSLATISSQCLSGAYNSAALLLVAGEAGPWKPAEYDIGSDDRSEGSPASLAFNADWVPATNRLEMYMKGRGLGDCGTLQTFAWDGARFRLVLQADMSECRGSIDFITTWHARVAAP